MTIEETTTRKTDKPVYYQHRIKHIPCSLHFIVCSDYEKWPTEGSTREQAVGEGTGDIHCPECGGTEQFLVNTVPVEGFIFQAVPGAVDPEKSPTQLYRWK